MSREIVEIVEVAKDGVWVEAVQRSACGSCSARTGCGQHTLSKLGKPVRLWVATDSIEGAALLSEGQEVVLSLPEGSLAMSALSLYGLPLVGLMGGAMLGYQGGSDVQSMVAGILGLVLGLAAAKWLARRFQSEWQPKIVEGCTEHPAVFNHK